MNIIIHITAQLKGNLLMQRQKAMFQICLKKFFVIKKVKRTFVICVILECFMKTVVKSRSKRVSC